jgi:iron complex outermembrane receptor protein
MSFFLALRKVFAERLNLNLMIRQDWIDFNIAPITPYFGFGLRLINEKDLIFKGNIARNYNYPTLNDLYWQPGGNPDLQPEEGYSYELGLEYKQNFAKHGFSTELTAFRSDINDWIIWIPSYRGYWEPRNIDRVLSRGIEFNVGLQGIFGKVGYKVTGSYAYTSSVNYGDPLTWGDESYGKQLVYIPLHSGNLMVNISYRGFYATYQHNSYSERFTTSSNDISRRDWLYPYYMNDLIIGKEFRIRKVALNAEFKIYNLFDETYHSVLYRPMPGRNFMLMLMIKYYK